MIKVKIPFRFLTSKNDKFVVWQGRPRLSKNYRDGKEAIHTLAAEQTNREPYDEPVMVSIEFHMPNKLRRDILNYTQQLCDGLEGIVYINDCLISKAVVIRGAIDKQNPRVEVIIIPAGEENE